MMIRQATKQDFKSLKNLLSQLTILDNPSENQINNTIYNNIYVAIKENRIIGCITLLIEDKIIHNAGKVGHIEDVVVDLNHRKNGIGKLLINHCIKLAKQKGCYKIILDCNESNKEFYEKCGFNQNGICMRFDIFQK